VDRTSAARRDAVIDVGANDGYFTFSCAAEGYNVLFSPIVTIRHHYSGQVRREIRTHRYHARNELRSTLMRCPLPFAVGIAGWRVFSQFRYACKRGWSWVIREPSWWWQALGSHSVSR
jgi:hypothetical protein